MLLIPIIKQKTFLKLHFIRTLQLVWKSGPKWTIFSLILTVIKGLAPLLSLYATKLLIDTITKSITTSDREIMPTIIFLVGITVLVSLLNNCATSLEELVSNHQARLVVDYMYGILHTKAIDVDLQYYENCEYYNKFQRALQEASYRPMKVVKGLVWLIQNIISLLALIGLLFSLHWGIAFVLFLSIIPNSLTRLQASNRLYQWQYKSIYQERLANYFHWILTNDWLAKEIRVFGLGTVFTKRFQKIRQQLRQQQIKLEASNFIQDLIAQIFSILAIFAAYVFIAYRAVQKIITLGDLVMYYQGFYQLQAALQGILTSVSELYSDTLFMANIYEFIDLKNNIIQPLHPLSVPYPSQKGIVFERVSYQYPNSSRQALDEINLTIKPNDIIALVGSNGSGKTTLIKLLCRLYEPTKGKIYFDGIDLCHFDLQELRNQISVIFQDYGKYNLTVEENIWLGDVKSFLNPEKIFGVAQTSDSHSFIKNLPQKYQTLLGNLFEGGEELSIGQWQKIGLARALLRESQIVVLDEPTSALDPKAEYEFCQKLRQLFKNRIVILVTHRLSTVKMADCIYVLDRGKIVESGNHDRLIQQRGIYADLFHMQAQTYR